MKGGEESDGERGEREGRKGSERKREIFWEKLRRKAERWVEEKADRKKGSIKEEKKER